MYTNNLYDKIQHLKVLILISETLLFIKVMYCVTIKANCASVKSINFRARTLGSYRRFDRGRLKLIVKLEK